MITDIPEDSWGLYNIIQDARHFLINYSFFETVPRNTNTPKNKRMFSSETILHGFTRACVEWHEEVIEGLEFALRVMEHPSDPRSRRERLADVTQTETTIKELIQILSTLPEAERRSFFDGFMQWRLYESKTGNWDI